VNARVCLAVPLALACAALSLLAPSARAQPARLAFGACPPAQVIVQAAGLQCATLDVPFDRANPAVGDIALAVQRVPASAPREGVIVLLAGGPGQPALPAFEALLAPLAHERALGAFELVAFDQRGTGQSEALQCPEPSESFSTSMRSPERALMAYLSKCGATLGATRSFYTSQESVEDLESLRQALGGPRLSLFAVSYGGRVAGMYARERPDGVARMVLDSPSPLTGSDPLERERLRALRRVLDEGICGAGACSSFSRDVYADLTRLVARLHRHSLRTRIYDDRGRLAPARVTEAQVLRLLIVLDLSRGARELAPAAIAAASHGDAVPLARLTRGARAEQPGSGSHLHQAEIASRPAALTPAPPAWGPFPAEAPESDSALSIALFAATYCIESELPWSTESPVAARSGLLRSWLASLPSGTTAPFAPATVRATSVLPFCIDWPPTASAPPSPIGISATPTLILSGEDDLRTPYEQDLAIAQTYTDGRLLQVPDVGHSAVSSDRTGCAKQAMLAFFTRGTTPLTCSGSNEPQALPLPPAALREVPAAASSSHLAGKVAAAAAITLEDLLGQVSPSGGGLRGGYWVPTRDGVVLHRMTDVPGVALTGSVHAREGRSGSVEITAHVTVRGRLAGELTLKGVTLNGRVGGARVHARFVVP
jgi:pimeloyl-ACP methyl ester carboxylesterase